MNTDPDFSNLLQQGINNTGLRFAPTSPLHDFKVAARKCDQRHFPWYHNKRMFLSLHPVYSEKGTSYRSIDSLQRQRECKDFREKSSHSATSPTRCHCRCMGPVPRRQRWSLHHWSYRTFHRLCDWTQGLKGLELQTTSKDGTTNSRNWCNILTQTF